MYRWNLIKIIKFYIPINIHQYIKIFAIYKSNKFYLYKKLIGSSDLTLVRVMSKVENIASVTKNVIDLIIELID